jgi:glycosyltransferase involved in cell wall biosynthesis
MGPERNNSAPEFSAPFPRQDLPFPMKVAHIITRLILGGAQENTLLTVEDQQRDWGDEVALMTGPALGPEGSLIERAKVHAVDLRIIPELRREIHPGRDMASYRALIRMLREYAPQLVHTHSSKAGILGRAAAASLSIPVVHTIHGSPFHPYQSRLAYQAYRLAERWAARRTQRLISVCDAMTDQYVAAGIAPREKFVTVYSGMEVEPFLDPPRPREILRRELGFEPEHVVVGKVARLFELKGHEYVIAAARTALARNPNLRFLFVGDGLLRSELERQIAAAGLSEQFVFTGLVPQDKVPELVGAMDVVVHASLREGLARVLPQGLIAGKPVVSYDVDGAREVVLPGETGFLLPPQAIAGMSDAILQLAADPKMRLRMGQTGRTRFTDQFRHQTMTRRLREVYAEVLAESHAASAQSS